MPKTRKKTPPNTSVIGPSHDPGTLYRQLQPFLEHLKTRNYSERTVEHRERILRPFISWCDERGLIYPQEITRPILERYQRHLYLYRKSDGQALSARSQCMRMVPVRIWFRWMVRTRRILSNPAADLDMPRAEKRLPKHILTAAEADTIMNIPDTTTAIGLRDRAILETLYSTGIRRLELSNLNVHDIDSDRGTLIVRQGKGKKDRLLPIGDRALSWVEKYRDEIRPKLAVHTNIHNLFLTLHGERIDERWLSQMARRYIKQADIGKTGSCHLFRHTMATLMLENGADIRYIQAMLGHEEITSTQIYTQVAIKKLKEIHAATHPAGLSRSDKENSEIDESAEAQIAVAKNNPPVTHLARGYPRKRKRINDLNKD